MDYHTLDALRRRHPAWHLLTADHAAFIIAFLYEAFTKPNRRTLAHSELIAQLDDYLYSVRSEVGESAFPRSANDYVNHWADDKQGWLRKFYPPASEEPHFDITPAVERGIEWLLGLEHKQFVGTESRLRTIFELLSEMVRGTETDPQVRIAELERRRAAIDAEVARLRRGELEFMDATQLKERFQQVEQTARELLSDFRQVEQNFRDLDRAVRERIALWEGRKGELLERIFGERDAIVDSHQGKSFRAFWDFLMSPVRQEELSALLERVISLDAISDMQPDPRLKRVHYDWLVAGEATQRTVARLSEQLRKYLDDQVWLEDRRIMTIIREIEQHAVAVRETAPEGEFMAVDDTAPTVVLALDRPLYVPTLKPVVDSRSIDEGSDDINAEALFEQVYVDKAALSDRIRRALQTRDQITLTTLLAEHPLERGLAELVAYLSLAAEDNNAVIDETRTENIAWTDALGRIREASMPSVIFSR